MNFKTLELLSQIFGIFSFIRKHVRISKIKSQSILNTDSYFAISIEKGCDLILRLVRVDKDKYAEILRKKVLVLELMWA